MHAETLKPRLPLIAGAVIMAAILSANIKSARAAVVDDVSSGFYLGVFGGYDRSTADVSTGPEIYANGGDFGFVGGFEINNIMKSDTRSGFNLGIEANYGWSTVDKTETIGVATVRVEKDHDWGANLRPGIDFDFNGMNMKPYAIIGYRRAEFETTAGGITASDTYDGLELGIGVELLAYKTTGMRLDYSHVFYNDKNAVDVDEDDVRLSLVYHF